MVEYSEQLIQETIAVWSPKYGYELSKDEAIEIIRNLTGFFEVLRDMANEISRGLDRDLINCTDYRPVREIDAVVPDDKGLYCIRLKQGSVLPSEYQRELEKRKSRLIYIGKAEKNTLQKRMLHQELRGRGHGTFFRSVGTMLGCLPPRGSLKDKSNQRNYKFSRDDQEQIVNWMNENLEVSWVKFDGPFLFEKYLIQDHSPLLNIDHNSRCLEILKADRERCRQFALNQRQPRSYSALDQDAIVE